MSSAPPNDDDQTVIRTKPAASSDFAPTAMETETQRTVRADAPLAPEDTLALPIGAKLGEFELIKRLGEGGFGIVYQAWDHTLDRQVALKEYLPTSIATRVGAMSIACRSERHRETFELGLRSFINEAKLLARFDHPSLVKVFRFWEANGTAYMAMPFYEGRTMRDTVRALPEPPGEAWLMEMLAALTEALAVIHAEQCYHRDIAPDNVMLLEGSGRPLLLDFGAARRVIGDITQALTVILKPGYAPVEQYAEVPGMKQGPWTDIYALAAVVHWCITGKTPPPSVGRMLADSWTPLSEAAAGRYSPGLLAAIDRALAVRPEQRTPDIATLRAELGLPPAAMPGQATVTRPAPAPASAPTQAQTRSSAAIARAASADVAPAARRSGLGLGLAAAGVAALLAAGGWYWMATARQVPTAPPSAASAESPAAKPALAPAPIEATPAPAPAPVVAAPSPSVTPPPDPVAAPAPQPTARPSPPPVAKRSERSDSTNANAAECARILQQMSLGESSEALAARFKALGCR